MRWLVILTITMAALSLSTTRLAAKGRVSGSRANPSASGTGSRSPQATASSRGKAHVVKGNYNPNTGKRTAKVARK